MAIAVSGVGGSAEVMREAEPAQGGQVAIDGGTFNGNSVACAAGLATLGYLSAHPEFYERTHAPRSAGPYGAPGRVRRRRVAAPIQG